MGLLLRPLWPRAGVVLLAAPVLLQPGTLKLLPRKPGHGVAPLGRRPSGWGLRLLPLTSDRVVPLGPLSRVVAASPCPGYKDVILNAGGIKKEDVCLSILVYFSGTIS